MAAYNDQLLTKLHKSVIRHVLAKAVSTLDPPLLNDMQNMWESNLSAMKASHPVPAPVAAPLVMRLVTIQVKVPKPGSGTIPVTVPSYALQAGASLDQLAKVFTAPSVGDALKLPSEEAREIVQQHIETALESFAAPAPLKDEADDESSDEEEYHWEVPEKKKLRLDLNIPVDSGDDLSEDEEATTPFESSNKMFCRWTKIGRKGVGWVYKFANGIISVDGREFVFQKADGFSDWRDRNIYEKMPKRDRDSNQIYRETMLGLSLQQCLQELVQNGRMTLQQSEEVLTCYDEEMFVDFGVHGVKNKLTLNAGNLIAVYGLHPSKDLTFRHTDVQVHSVERKRKIPLVSADKLTTVATKLPSARKQKKTRRA